MKTVAKVAMAQRQQRSRKFLPYLFLRSGGAHVSHQCYKCLTPAPWKYLIEVTLVTSEKSVVQFDSTKHRRFPPSTPVPLAVKVKVKVKVKYLYFY